MRPSLFKVGDRVTVSHAYRKGQTLDIEHCACDTCFETDRFIHPANAVVVKVHKTRWIAPRSPGQFPNQHYSLKIEDQPGVWTANEHALDRRCLIEMIGELGQADLSLFAASR